MAQLGAPARKLLLGIPSYARSMSSPSEARTYAELRRDGLVASKEADESSDGVWYFNGPATVAAKAREVKLRGLAGAFVWEAGQDELDNDEWSLLANIRKALFDDARKSTNNNNNNENKEEHSEL